MRRGQEYSSQREETSSRSTERHVTTRQVTSQVQGMLVQEGILTQSIDGTPPVFERVFSNARFAQGGNALFEGRVVGQPKPVVSWTRKGAPLLESGKYKLKYEEQTGNVSLQINNIGPGDEGEYTCTARNQLGEAICSVYIQPEGFAVPAHQQGIRQEMTQIKQSQQTLQGGYQQMQTTQRTQQVQQTMQYSNGFTTIEEDFKVDTFEYRILREVSFRESLTRRYVGESDAILETRIDPMLGPPAPPQVQTKPRNSKQTEGADVVFSAKVPANPRPRLTWFKNGKRVVSSQKHQTSYTNQQASLKINQVSAQDSGHYTLLAENPQGCVVTSAYLAVEPSITQEQFYEREISKTEETIEGKMIAPNFVRACADRDVTEGKMTRFDCRVTGRPYPEVTWYINGKQVTDDATHKILVNESGNHALMITNISRLDSGTVTCIAKNKAGESSFECKLNVIEKELVVAPQFVQRFSGISIKEGDSFMLTARAVGTPIPNISWQKDGVPVTSGAGLRITIDGGSSSLEVVEAKASDAGWYQCTAQNMAGSTATRARVHVQKIIKQDTSQPSRLHLPTPTTVIQPEPAPEPEIIYLRHVERAAPKAPRHEEERRYPPPQFIIPLTDATQVEGSRIHLEARVEPVGDPTMNVDWYHNGRPLPASSRLTTTFRFGFIALDLLSVVAEDAGEYTCVVQSSTGHVQSTSKVTITSRATIEAKSQYPESLEYIRQLEDYSKYQRSESIEETTSARPVFIRPLRDLGQTQEGRNAHFEGQITPVSDPTMRVDWFKDGKPITASSRITTIFNFGYVSLNILHLRSEDSGIYTVRAVNRWGEAVSQSSLVVIARSSVTSELGIPEQQRYIESVEALEGYLSSSHRTQPEPPESIQPPVFQSPIKDQGVREGGFAHFEARLEPVGDSTLRVEWLKDGRPVEASSRITTFFNFGYVALTIKSVAAHDAGKYTCRAYNMLGEATTSAILNVISKQDSVVFDSQHASSLQKIQHLEDSSRYMKSKQEEVTVTQKPRFLGPLKGTNKIVEGQRAHFEARVEPLSDTTMRIEWYFNGKILQTANRIQTYHDFGYVAVDIMSVRAEDAGTYTVVARNALGEAQLSATMQVETRSGIDSRSMHHGAYDKTKHMEERTHIEPQYNIEEISKSRPIFVQPLSDIPPISEGKNVHLECRLEPMGDPTMRVEWFLNGKPITVGSRFRTYYDFGYVALDIIHVTSLDSGEYTVRATNHLGSAHTSACVRVMSRSDILTETQNESSLEQIELLESRGRRIEREEAVIAAPPVFTRPLHNIETLEGTNVHLECRLQPVGDSTMKVDWLVNGKPVRIGHRFRPAYDFDYVALDLLSVYPEDSGVYTCIARNHLGEAVTSSSVRVIAKKDLLLESQHPGGLEKIQYLEDSSRYKRADVVDEMVTIKPKFITKPKSVEGLREGGHAHFECKLEPVTDSNLKVEWFKNGRPIIVGHRFRPIHDFGYVALDIIDTIAEDSGVYTCRATNLLGTDETSCSLKCLRSSQIVTTTQNEAGLEQIQYLEDRSKYQRRDEIEETTRQAPVFTTSLKQCDIREGQRAHFECRLIPVSDNTMKVEWFHNGQPVKSGSRFTETNNFGFVALDILHCLPEDSGTYTCRAKNINGEAVTSSTLNVQSRKSIYLESQHEAALSRLNQFETREYHGPSGPEEAPSQPPVFTQPCRDQRLAEGASAHFEARLIPVGDARLKVEWLRNGVPIQASNRITTMHDFGYVALNMKHVYPEDSGTYTCRAVNDLGQAVTSATLLVQSKASLLTESQHEAALQKLQALEDSSKYRRTEEEEIIVTQKPSFSVQLNGPTSLMEGQSAHYECRVEPYPDANLKVEWFHNGQPLQTGHRFRTAFDFGFATLDILTVYEEDKGEYTCRATNKLGQAVSSVKLNVQSRASIIRDTQHKEALQRIQYLEDDSRYKRTTDEEVTIHERPEFGRPLKNIEHLPEGRMAHLEATLTPVNDATMKVEWFRNGRPIPQGHRFKTTYDFGFVALDILYAYAEDSGTYMCKARNVAGEAVTTCSIQVDSKEGLQLDTLDEQRLKKIKELEHYERPRQEEIEPIPQKPVFITPLNSLENLKEGEHAHLECRVEPISDANLRIEWFVNGKAIKTGHRFRTTHDFGYVALDILYVYAEDSGTYMCKATNLMGEAVNTSTIRVQSRHNILLETQHPEGLEKIRELEAQGHPTKLELEEPLPNPPRFITHLRGTTEIAEGGTAHFEAQIEPLHDPNLRVEVYHNGKPLGSASRFHITFDFGYFALDVGHCLASDAGEYTVKAINKLGSAVSSTTLKVVERGSIILDSQRPEGLEKIRELEREAPKRPEAVEPVTRQRPVFTQPLQNIDTIAEGQTAHFECRLIPVGDPTLKVEWFRNEKILEDSSRITKTHDFGYVSMDMTHVREEDEGVYMCRASNALGEAVTTASMKIKSKASIQLDTQHPEGMRKIRKLEEGRSPLKPADVEPTFEKPIFTQVLTGPSELWEGQTAHFEARVVPIGDPTMRYHWYVNGTELKMGSRFHVTHDFGFVTLDIMSTVPEDSGLYMCKAVNAAGEAVSSTTLKVKPRSAISGEPIQPEAWQKIKDKEAALGAKPERPEEPVANMPPIFTRHLTNQENLTEGSHVYIEAQVEPRNDPNLRIEWYKNGKSLTTGTRIRTTFDFGLVTLSVNGVRPDDSGIYTCKAINMLGEAVSTCTIKIEDRHWLLANSLRPEALPLIDALEGPKEGRPEAPEPVFEGPVFISHLNNVVCTEGENSHFECRVEPAKDPTLQIEFFANGKPLPTGSRFKGNHDFGFVTLDINSCYAEDSGVYTVKATNSKGQASTSGTLKCTSKTDIYLQTQHPTGQAGLEKVKEVDESFASKYQRQVSGPEKEWPKPVWTKPLQPEFKLLEAQPLHLEATVEPKDDPHLRIEWFFNGKSLAHGSRFKMTSEFGFVTLDLTEVYERDQGIYTCKAWNRSGEAFTSTTIYCTSKAGLIEKTQHPKGQEGLGKIQELEESLRREEEKAVTPDEGQPPSFTSKFQDVRNLSEGEIAHFEASLVPVGDQSMVVEWFYNGKTIEASHRIRTVHAFGMVVLEILGTKIEDSGTYTCRATNKWGKDEISVTLECIDVTKGQKPQFTTHIKSIDGLKDGDSAHFECTLIPVGDPNMKVEWFHNGHPIRHSTRIKQVSDFGFVLMDIAYTQSHDSGEYVCRAKNKYGEDFTRAHITCVGKGGVYLESLQPESLAKIRELESAAAPGAQTPTTPVNEPPRFITQITDITTLKEGQSAHFEARLVPVNDPNLKVEWYYNGKKLPHGHRYRTFHDFGIVILDILYCYAENSGEYEARATNLVGSDSTKAILKCSSKAGLILESQLPQGMEGGLEKIQDLEDAMIRTRKEQVAEDKKQVPVFTVPLSNIDSLREGESAHFEARLIPTDDPRLKVEWFWNNKPLRTGSRFRTFHDFGFVILEISPVYPEDSGEYSCRATNEWGQAVTTSTMKVEGKRSIIIESQLPKGMEGTIEKIAELEGLGSSTTGPIPEDDVGKPPEFITSPTDQTLVEYSVAHFECRLIPLNDPSLRVEWFHNGKPLTAGSRFKTINDFGFVILEIAQIDTRDSGLYTCKATNKHGEAVVSCKLDVRGRQSIIMEPQLPNTFSSGTESIQKLEEELHKKEELLEQEERPNPPKFIVEIEDVEVIEGGKAHFECRVEPVGDPTMRIDWFFNGRPFATGSRVHMINDFGYIVLDMDYIYARDSGEYLCRATNRWGTATTRAALICKAKHDVILESQLPHGMTGEKLKELEKGHVTEPGPESPTPKEPPKFITQISSATVGENEPVRFECRVEPKSDSTMRIEWYRNGKLLPSGHRYRTLFDMGFVSLDILYVYPEDSGEYVCRAVNAYGEDFTKATVSCKKVPSIILQNQVPKGMKKSEQLMQMEATIKKYTSEVHLTEDDLYEPERKQPPRFVTQIQDQTELVEMEATKFECQLAPVGDPNMKVEWFFNGKPLHHKNRFTPIYDFGYVAMNFGWVYPEDSGEYLCRATNLYGQDETRAIIKTTGKPGIIYESQLPKGMKSIEKIREMEASWQVVAEEKEEEAKEKEKPVFVSKPEATIVNEGECARFCCRVTGYPRPRVMWLINNNTVINGTRYRLTYDGMWHLDIPKTRQYDQGKIEVVARNAAGETRVETTLTVKPRGDDYRGVLKNSPRPWYDVELAQYQAERQETELEKVFEERAATHPEVTPELLRQRTAQTVKEPEPEWTQGVRNKKSEEYYSKIRELEEGQIVKENRIREASHQFAIPGEKITKKSVARGMAQSYENSLAKEEPELMPWQKGRTLKKTGKLYEEDGTVQQDTTVEKVIEKRPLPGPLESTVHGKEVHTAVQKQTQKEVKGDQEITRKISTTETTEVEHKATTQERVVQGQVKPAKPPVFTRKIQPVRAFEQEQARFEVEFDGDPLPTIKWYREDFPITSSPDLQIHTFSTKSVLILRQVYLEDSGVFSVIAENRGGRAKCSANLVVEEKRRAGRTGAIPPSFLTTVQAQIVKAGQLCRFDTKIHGTKPLDVYWLKDGKKITADIRYKTLEEDNVYTLLIIETALEDSGNYECVAINSAGEARCEGQLIVEEDRKKGPAPTGAGGQGAAPSVVQPLTDQTKQEGQSVVFRCRIASKQAVQVQWYKGAEVIKPSKYFQMGREGPDTYTLRISEVFPEDEGQYKCVLSNPSGQLTLTANLKVLAPDTNEIAPTLVQMRDVVVQEGSSAQFRTQVNGKPTPTIQWYREGDLIPQSPDFQMIHEGKNVVLLIATTYEEDSGTFTCRATNSAGQAETSARLIVKKKEEKGEAPRFTKPLKPKVAKRGSLVMLECEVTGLPMPEVVWFRAGTEIVPDEKHTILTEESGKSILTIVESEEIDESIYSVKATNRFGKAESRANIVLSEIPEEQTKPLEAPRITKPLEALVVPKDSPTVLDVSFTGFPVPSVKWYRNGKEIISEDIEIEEYRTKLVIKKTTKKQTGKYEVRVVNQAGEARTSGTVQIIEIEEIEEMEKIKAPRFIKPLKPEVVCEDEVVIMEAVVEAYPTASFQWFLHDTPVITSTEVRVTSEANKSVLLIQKASEKICGNITCRAENVVGSVTSTASVSILPEFETTSVLSPSFIEKPVSAKVMDGEPVLFTAKVVGKPTPQVCWSHNNQPIVEGKGRTVTQDSEGVCQLAINEVFPEDCGVYTITATNTAGQAVAAVTLVVDAYEYFPDSEIASVTVATSTLLTTRSESEEDLLEKEEMITEVSEDIGSAPSFSSPLPKLVETNEGELVRLRVKAEGKPQPKVHWFKEGKELFPSEEFLIDTPEEGVSELTITQVYPDDIGEIVCEAHNELGIATTTTFINLPGIMGTVEYRKPEWVTHMEDMQAKLREQQAVPTFIREITDEYVNEEETVTFACQYAGTPQPVIIWYHDDKLVRATENVKITIKDNTSTVTIKRATNEDAGIYICKATSDIGIAVTKAKLTIVGGTSLQERSAEETEEKVVTEVTEEKKAKKKKKKKPIITHEDKPRDSVDVSEVQPLESVTTFSETLEMATAKKRVDVQESVEVTAVASCKKVPDDKEFPTDVPDVAGIVAPIQESVTVSETTSAETTGEFFSETRQEEFANIQTRTTMKKAKVHKTTTQVRETEEKIEMAITEDMLPWQAPLQELAQVDVLLRKGVTVQEVVTLYEAWQFPALRTAPAQSALVSLVERQGHSSLITEMVTHESVDQTLAGVFKAFLTMVERKAASVSEIISLFKPADFQTAPWETTSAMPVLTEETATETISKTSKVEIKEMKKVEKKRREVKKQEVETEEGASLQITKLVEEFGEHETKTEGGQLLFSICSYTAETDDALNLVEGERVYIIESTNSDWWFVKKHLTEERGWVPAVYLRDEPSYTLYVQKKLHEKIDKLPIFEKPGPGTEVNAPKFVEKLQPKHVPDGATVQFECKVVGNPRPQITWFRQTAIIKPSHDFQIFYDDDNVATLIISEVFPEDAGTFTCVAKNAAGFASSTTELVVETPLSDHGSETGGLSRRSLSRESSLADILEGIPPTFSKKPKAKVAPVGSNVELEVRLVAVPEPDITWSFKGKQIISDHNKTVITSSDMHMYSSILSLKNISQEEEGTYTIVAKNREGEASLDITLKLKPKGEEGPFIVEPLRDISATEGEGIILSTTVTGSPSPKVTWLKDGKPVKGTEVSGDTYTLTLRDVKPNDVGKYTLKATNKSGTVETSAQLNVLELKRAQAPLFVERFEEQKVQEKGTIRLTAKVIGNPIPSITWLRNNKTLLASPRITEMFDGEQILLEIEKADSEQDSGDYKCVATNTIGSATHGARVTIDVAKVTFTKPLPKESESRESYPLTLECETSHTVSTTWYHNGVELSGMDHRELVQEGRRQMIVFKRVLSTDKGTYTCAVKDQKTSTTLKVQEVKPDFVRKLEDFEVKEQECAVLEVEVSSEAAKVIWEKDGMPLEPLKDKIEIEKRGPVHKLFIRSTSVHDEGEYTCRLGDEECTAEVTVIELPPEILTPLSDTTVPRGEKALFEVELTKGDALVRWFKDDTEIQFSEHIQLSIDGKRQRLKIYQAKDSDAGVYTCQVGDQKSKAKLTVQEPKVEFITRLPDVTMLPVGSEAEFVVELSRSDVEVKWLKKGKEIKLSDKFIISSDGAKHKLIIKKVTLEDQSDYSCIAMNIKTTTKLKIEVIETAPKIQVVEKTYKVQKGEDVEIVVKFTGNPKPTAEWVVNGTVITPNKRISSKVEEDSASLTIKKVVDTDVGNYVVKLKNSVGEASAELTLVIIDVPDAPGIPEVVEITDTSITLHWAEPKSDGNSPIKYYILEHHDKEEFLTWHEITDISSTTHKVTNLVTGHEIMFRVSAVNTVGRGKTSDSSRYIKILLPTGGSAPTVCKPLNDTSAGLGSSVTLECVISGFPQPEVKWFKDGKPFKTKAISYTDNVAKLTISKCVETSGGVYSCKATNNSGAAETSCKLSIQDIPTLSIDDDHLSVQVGIASQWKPIITYSGYPKPEVKWSKDEKPLVEDKRIKCYVDETTTTIAIYSTERTDSGIYTVKATNIAGTASLDLNLKVIDKPSSPQLVEIKDVDSESVTVCWQPPADDGGVDISKYSLEKCEISKKIWTKVADIERDARSYSVQRLLTNAEYMFRIFAQNPVGVSEPAESESVRVQSKYGLPSAPEGPLEVSGMTDTSCTLSWGVPFSDGGTPILDYLVERKEGSKAWIKIGSTKELHIVTSDLKKGASYEFKVSARNRVGEGQALFSDQIIAGTKKTPPSPPENVQVTNIASKSVTLSWEPPLSNGGSELTGYVIEKQTVMSNLWTKVVTLDATVTNYTVENLKEKSEFYFRVFAENGIGLSFPTTTSLVSLKTHATVPSPPTAPLEVRSTGSTSVFLAWGVPESDGGAPLEGYKVAVRDVKKTMWMEVGRVSADVQRLTVKDLQENHEYLIRIFARNEVGFSKPLESDEPFKVQRPTAEAEDTDLEELGFDKETPSLSFTTTTTQSWMREAGMDADIYSYSRSSLLRRSEYFFRIWYYAKNLFQ